MIAKVISGGQTGVDRAALDASLACGIPIGGYCPRGRLAEDGRIPDRYPLDELDTEQYPPRTRANVMGADATLLLHRELPLPTSPGSRLTLGLMRASGKPWKQVHCGLSAARDYVVEWLLAHPQVKVLNVAGPRESSDPGIGEAAEAFLVEVFTAMKEHANG